MRGVAGSARTARWRLRPTRRQRGRATPAAGGEVLDALLQRIQPARRARRRGGRLEVGTGLAGEGERVATQRCGSVRALVKAATRWSGVSAPRWARQITVSGSPGREVVTNQLPCPWPARSTWTWLSGDEAETSECSSQPTAYRISKGSLAAAASGAGSVRASVNAARISTGMRAPNRAYQAGCSSVGAWRIVHHGSSGSGYRLSSACWSGRTRWTIGESGVWS